MTGTPPIRFMTLQTEDYSSLKRRLILRDSLTFLSLVLITVILFLITFFLFRSFATHREDPEARPPSTLAIPTRPSSRSGPHSRTPLGNAPTSFSSLRPSATPVTPKNRTTTSSAYGRPNPATALSICAWRVSPQRRATFRLPSTTTMPPSMAPGRETAFSVGATFASNSANTSSHSTNSTTHAPSSSSREAMLWMTSPSA